MKTIGLLAAASVLAGCVGERPNLGAGLHCPAQAGELRRTSVQPGGEICTYRTARGDEVLLRRVQVPGSVPDALKATEDEVWAGRRDQAKIRVLATPAGGLAIAPRDAPAAVIPKSSYPIVRNGENDVFVGGMRIKGDPGFGIIRYERAAALKGDLFRRRQGIVRGLVHTGEVLPGGYRTLAYEAAGSTSGPLAVVLFRSRQAVDDLPADARRLARANGGV